MLQERNHGIDLLRLLLAYMVCILHTLGRGGILWSMKSGTAVHGALWLLEIIAYCAVDGFALISGYTASAKERKYEKLVTMWFQAFFYSFILTGIFVLLGVKKEWPLGEMIEAALPVTTRKFWYFTAYFGLYFAMPMINRFFFEMGHSKAQKALLVLFALFSLMEVGYGTFHTQAGYSTIWLMVLYCIGLLIRKTELFKNKSTIFLIALWAVCIAITWYVQFIAEEDLLTSYVSPTILLSGIILVILFSRLKLRGTWISKLAPLAFGIYLFQASEVVWDTLIDDAFKFAAEMNNFASIVYAFAGAGAIFACGLCVEALRRYAEKKLHIKRLSEKIVRGIDWLLCKLSVLLK